MDDEILCLNSVYNGNNLVGKLTQPFVQGFLNKKAYTPAEGFFETRNYCNADKKAYTTRDARLVDTARSIQTTLDSVPYEGSVWMDDVYNTKYVPSSYNRQPKWYGDIEDGQIFYYIDPEVAPAFRKQIYNMEGATKVTLFTTPMGRVDPEFTLVPSQSTFNNMSKDTYARDQLVFRNDLTSLQQKVHNRQRYEALR